MAGFAVSLEYMAKSPNATMPYRAGYEEDDFLKSIGLKMDHIEPKANNCTEILVWHTQTTKSKAPMINVKRDALINDKTSLQKLLKGLESKGVGHITSSGGK
jgi:beta-1,3-glucuronyltransferase S